MMYTRLLANSFLFVAACLMATGLGVSSELELKDAPLFNRSNIFLNGPVHELYPRMLSGFQDTINFEWPELSSTNVVTDPQESLQSAIFLTLFFGGILRFLMSDSVRHFFHDTFDPINWSSYE